MLRDGEKKEFFGLEVNWIGRLEIESRYCIFRFKWLGLLIKKNINVKRINTMIVDFRWKRFSNRIVILI